MTFIGESSVRMPVYWSNFIIYDLEGHGQGRAGYYLLWVEANELNDNNDEDAG